jgi:hypothetical protein
MTATVLGLMKTPEAARGAMEALDREGLEREAIDPAEALLAKLAALGVPENDAHLFVEGVRRGGTLVCVRAEDEMEAEHAAHLLMAHGAVDLEACAAHWKSEGPFGDIPSAPAPIYFRRRTRLASSAYLRGAVTDGPYTGPERRGEDEPYTGVERRTEGGV